MSNETSGSWRRLSLVACLTALCLASSLVLPGGAHAGDSPDPQKLLLSMRGSYAPIRDYTATFTKQERINGDLRPREAIYMKFQKPFKVYMKWVSETKAGQEVLYVKGENDDKALAHPGFGGLIGQMISLIIPTFAISPDGPSVMQDNRHPITNAGIGSLIESIIKVNSEALANGDLKLTFKGEAEVGGRPAWLVERILPHKDGYPGHRTQYYIDKGYNLPVKVVLHDWSDNLTAYYEYSSLVLNPGLRAADFEVRNKEYRFGIAPPIIKD